MPKAWSLRFWVAAAMALALVPLGISAIVGYFTLKQGVIDRFEDVAGRQRQQVTPLQDLRVLIWDALVPVDEFIGDGDSRHVSAYRETRTRVEATFAALDRSLVAEPSILTLVERSRDDWTAADRIATDLLSVRRSPNDPTAVKSMESFDGLIASVSDKLGAVYASIGVGLRADHRAAELAYERSEWVAGIAAAVSLLSVLLGIFVIGRVVASSVDRLVEGADRFARGDRDHRIDVQVPPELHRVAEEFNQMIGRIQESEEALSDLAHRDGLTRLMNRRAFDEALAEMFARHERFGEKFSVLIADLDHFKSVNDRYGHGIGDDVLRTAAHAMTSDVRPFDHVFRIGGEEFAVLLPGADEESARTVADRLRLAVAARTIPTQNGEIEVAVSIGGAAVHEGADARLLVEAADAALYVAKESGRNRVVMRNDSNGAQGVPAVAAL